MNDDIGLIGYIIGTVVASVLSGVMLWIAKHLVTWLKAKREAVIERREAEEEERLERHRMAIEAHALAVKVANSAEKQATSLHALTDVVQEMSTSTTREFGAVREMLQRHDHDITGVKRDVATIAGHVKLQLPEESIDGDQP